MSDSDNNDKDYSEILRDNDRFKDTVKEETRGEEEEDRRKGKRGREEVREEGYDVICPSR